MKYQFLIGVALFLGTACGVQRFQLRDCPTFTTTTTWQSQQQGAAAELRDADTRYRTQVVRVDEAQYEVEVRGERPEDRYRFTWRRSDLAITGFVAGNTVLEVYLPLLQFPLYRGKTWRDTLRLQEHPRGAIRRLPAKFEVKAVEPHDYVAGQELGSERKAFLILTYLPDRVLHFYYLSPSKHFPGTNPVDLFLGLDWFNPNAERGRIQVTDYQR
ncbi:MAG: hypothetical protein AAFW73_09680 [Bacteroidota bacterium]